MRLFLLQGIFLTQGSNRVPYISCIGRRILYLGSPHTQSLIHSINVELHWTRDEARGYKIPLLPC